MDVRTFFSNPLGALADWIKAHEEFIAVHLSRILAVVFILVAVFFLLKSLGLV